VGAADISKLKASGYYTVAVSADFIAVPTIPVLIASSQAVHAATRRTLSKIKGFSEVKVDKIKEAIAKCQVCTSSVCTSERIAEIKLPT